MSDLKRISENGINNSRGFTLIEVMIVLMIAGILATGVVFMFANPSAKVKGQAFNILGDFNMARSEAVTRNEDVLVDFIEGAEDGYQICFDTDSGGDCDDETGDNFIRETIFPEKVQYYDPAALPDRGPATTPAGVGNLIGKSGIILDDAGSTEVTSFSMEPDGTLEDGITENINVVVFAPKGSPNVIHGTPYAITISPSSGRVRISRWIMGDDWFRK